MFVLPFEILQEIINFLDHKSQVHIKYVSKEFNQQLYITNLYVDFSKSKKITNEIINKNNNLLYLNLYENNIVTNLSNLNNLIKLNISNSHIKYNQIKHGVFTL